jgi:hypothetical protein
MNEDLIVNENFDFDELQAFDSQDSNLTRPS